jgi:hypothetical protein
MANRRYENVKISSKDRSIKDPSDQNPDRNYYNKSYYQTTIYKNIPERNGDIHLISTTGDRFDNLAYQFYGDPHLWWYIAKANGYSTMNVPADRQIRVPVDLAYAKVELK